LHPLVQNRTPGWSGDFQYRNRILGARRATLPPEPHRSPIQHTSPVRNRCPSTDIHCRSFPRSSF
jgi:hypothetical protein